MGSDWLVESISLLWHLPRDLNVKKSKKMTKTRRRMMIQLRLKLKKLMTWMEPMIRYRGRLLKWL